MHKTDEPDPIILPGHFVGLKWVEGWWFIQVLGSSDEELKPWILLNENGNNGPIAAGTAGDRDDFQDERDRLLLEPNDNERGLVHQLLFGVEPSRMQLFPEFGREQNLGLEENIAPGEDEMWITGFDSPYNNPSIQSEIFYVNDMAPLRIQAFNPMDTADEARLSIHVNRLHYATVTDVNLMKAMLQGQVRSHKHMMGLGAVERDQLQAPEWLIGAFGEHIKETRVILSEGDTTQAQAGAQALDFRESVQLSGAEREGGGG